MDIHEKEVRYEKWCGTCRWKNLPDYEEPCNECMERFTNFGTDRPVRYEKKE